MPRTNKRYEPEFKIKVVEDMRKNQLGYSETARKYNLYKLVNGYQYPAHNILQRWERQYLEKGKDSFFIETRGRARLGKGSKPKLNKKGEEDLIAENQRLRMENEFLKKLKALVIEREQKEKKSHK